MAQRQNECQGVLFTNTRKTTHNQPDYSGSVTVNGQDYWMSAWTNTCGPNTKTPGATFYKVKLTKKDDQTDLPLDQPAAAEAIPGAF
jgi:hypothetical protein